MRVAQTPQESPDTGTDLEVGMPAAEQDRNINANSSSLSNLESAKTKGADLQLWVPKAGVSLALWTSSEEQLLTKLKNDGNSWRVISKALPNRTARAAESHWSRMQKASRTKLISCAQSDIFQGYLKQRTPWLTDDRQRLKEMKEHGASWKEVVQAFPNRTLTAIQLFWRVRKGHHASVS